MEVRFYALSVIEEALRLRSQALESSGALLNLRSSLWVWIQTRLSDSEPVYLRNKLATLVSLIFQQSYLGSWHGFFEDLLALGYSHQGKPDEHPLYIDFFLRVSGIIDEEIVAGSGARESAIQTRIKDAMRVSATKKLTESWLSILITFHESRPDLASMVFRLFGLYVSWIDVQLVLNDRFLALLFSSLNNSEALRIPATECLTEIVAKGMKPSEKLALIQGLNVHSLLERLCSVSASEPDDVLDTATARLVNLTGSEICSSLETSQFSPDLRHIAFDLLDRIFPSLLSVLSKTDIEIISIPFSFLSSFLSCLKKLKKLAKDDVPLMPGLKEKLASLLRILVLKMRYDLDSTFTLSLESNEDDQFLTFRRVSVFKKQFSHSTHPIFVGD